MWAGRGKASATERASLGYFGKSGKSASVEQVDFASDRAHPILPCEHPWSLNSRRRH